MIDQSILSAKSKDIKPSGSLRKKETAKCYIGANCFPDKTTGKCTREPHTVEVFEEPKSVTFWTDKQIYSTVNLCGNVHGLNFD